MASDADKPSLGRATATGRQHGIRTKRPRKSRSRSPRWLRKRLHDPRFKELGERLEDLKQRHEQGLLTSLEFLKELLNLAKDMVAADEAAPPIQEKEHGKTALTEVFEEARNPNMPIIVERVVNDIDEIVRMIRFDGWQNTHAGEREVKKALRRTLFKYKLHQNQELFDKAYRYIRRYYLTTTGISVDSDLMRPLSPVRYAMASQYSHLQFFRRVPKKLLGRCFQEKYAVLSDLGFDKFKSTDVDPIFEAFTALPADQQATIEADFQEIDSMACQAGVTALADEAAFHDDAEFARMISKFEGFHEAAMWAFLEHPSYWSGATLFLHSDNISDSLWKKRNDLPPLTPRVHEDDREQFAKAISRYFHTKEGRGRNCKVEVYRRHGKEYFFAYP